LFMAEAAMRLITLGRIGLFLLIWLGVWSAIAFPLFRQFRWRPFSPIPTDQKLRLLLPLYGLAPIVLWGMNRWWGQSWHTQGLRWQVASLRLLGIGIGIAIGGLALLVSLKLALGLMHYSGEPLQTDPDSWWRGIGIGVGLLAVGLGIGGIEELVFRGWMQTQLESGFNPFIAATIGSFIFAVAHLVWDGQAGWWQQPGLFVLGWVLVVARWAGSGNLALAWGLHAGWVWGLAIMSEVLKLETPQDKPIWLAGRSQQPLTSVLDIALLLSTAGLVWLASGSTL
jgi:membrane protease YdiL (CAAX protease family)